MAESKRIIENVWPIWEFECPECQTFHQIDDVEFGPLEVIPYGDSAEFRCANCDTEYVVKKPEL